MRYLRLMLVALLTLTLPLSAFASMGLKDNCVMKANGVVVSVGEDCCDKMHKMKFSAKSQSCKAGQECNNLQSPPPATTVLASPALPVAYVIAAPQDAACSFHLRDALWRPPRVLS